MSWYDNPDDYAQRVMPTLAHTRHQPPTRWTAGRERLSVDDIAGLTADQELDLTATHEAAHAVLFLAAGHTIESITLHPASVSGNKATVVKNAGAGPWLDIVICYAAGERAADRQLRETNLWTPDRAWAMERLAGDDRAQAAIAVFTALGRAMTYGLYDEWSDYSWICDRADEALQKWWPQTRALAQHLLKHPQIDGIEAARAAGF